MEENDLKAAAARSVEGSGDIRAKVRDLTLQAIRERRFDFAGMRDVMQQVAEGISIGAEKRGSDVRQAVESGFKGLDEALSKSLQATQLAMSELASRGRDFNEQEFRSALDAMKKLEADFSATMSQVAEQAGTRAKGEMQTLASHTARAATDTSAVIAKTLQEFSQRMTNTAAETTHASFEAARLMTDRLAQATSGFLSGLSDALARKDDRDRS